MHNNDMHGVYDPAQDRGIHLRITNTFYLFVNIQGTFYVMVQPVIYESVLVPHSSLKCNSKFPVGMSKFPVQTQNFQLDKVEISSSNSKFPVGMSKFPV